MESDARAAAVLEPMAWNKTMLGPVLRRREEQSRGLHALYNHSVSESNSNSNMRGCSDGRGQGV